VKYAWIDAQRREFPLPDMCEALTVSISGYRAWKPGGKPDRTRLTDPQAVALMKSIHVEMKAAYGSRRLHRERSPHRPAPSRAADARAWHPSAAQAALQGDDGLQALDAGGAEPAGPRLHARGVDWFDCIRSAVGGSPGADTGESQRGPKISALLDLEAHRPVKGVWSAISHPAVPNCWRGATFKGSSWSVSGST
jgi:hypothetical protein